jgi:16S rRNA (adenine1518-N6/adenine1519-N6)-dimethyltransferase
VQTQSEIRAILAAHGISPKHRFGQNFLVDHNLLRRLVDASEIGVGSLVLEIGPGTGTMSEELLARGAELVAVELDRDMAAILRERLSGDPRFTLFEGDCLDGKRALNADVLTHFAGRPFTLVANLPYQAASPVMAICAGMPQCLGQFVTVQREVGDRLRAAVGTGEYGPLTIIVQAFAEVEQLAIARSDQRDARDSSPRRTRTRTRRGRRLRRIRPHALLKAAQATRRHPWPRARLAD